ncbi:MAG: 3-deoxy-D-manno-octulosonic-acid transferase [Phycisphaerales bacterium]|jgi:3-deoxy-D-manno-octulosonic-acid transferase|nr:3-deoxy-D-manno-octulosonic-acid transferase [Phycisphaerales bacterium]
MINFYDIAWGVGVAVAAPYWLIKPAARAKVLGAFRQRMGQDIPRREGDGPCILIHAVSLGEMNATRALVEKLRESRPGVHFVISSTTETGFARGQELYTTAGDVTLIRYPLDFSAAIARVLDAARPDLVVLMELEVWPNFMKHCERREIPVVLANARLTESSFRNYRRGGPIVRKMFRRLTLICAQDDAYGVRFLELGVPHHHVVITGTMKFDNANLGGPVKGAYLMAMRMGVKAGLEQVWVCGSTGPGEEEIVLRVYRKLLPRHARLRLIIVPRHPQRFDEVADLIFDNKFDCVRLSHTEQGEPLPPTSPVPPVVLIDAMGVLREYYALASVVFVGRSLVDLGPRQHGSDMIEPAALGKAVVVGPHTSNFADAMMKFRAARAMYEVESEASLEQTIGVLLSTPTEVKELGQRAAEVVRREQGATMRHARVIVQILSTKRGEELPRPATPPATEQSPPAQPASVRPPPPDTFAGGIPGVAADAVTQSPPWLVIRPIRKP